MHHGIVKSVVSGDTVILMGVDASKGPPPEKLLSLSGIAAATTLPVDTARSRARA